MSKNLSGAIDCRLIKVNRYIRENYSQPLCLHTLSDIIQCHPTYLCNTYSKVFKISPMKYLQSIRMIKAAELLTQSNDSIGEIAKKLGYISNSQFTDLFKRWHGVPPMMYRSINSSTSCFCDEKS
ncbi:helix-turn-helix domain-containing protein [Paenibacillus sp. RRE4]|uniref:helix-turn-helix domain-containing protein n=1 Tax=Paenibacillus sp. RRE4 TaxID=2962587 RepID=UPI0037C8428F